jgi:hypothetical protein
MQTITATDTAFFNLSSSLAADVSPGPFAALGVVAPTNASARSPFLFTVNAQDAFGNTVPGLTVPLTFTSTDPLATLPSVASLSNSLGTFSATLASPGNQTIHAVDASLPSISGTSNAIVVPQGIATQFRMSAPTSATLGNPVHFSVSAEDPAGNIAPGYSGTVHFTSTDA